MPTYEYACQKCHHEFEQFQSMRDDPLKKCPKCKKVALKRLVGGGAGLIFKGTGFYITDYKKSGAGKKEGAAAPKSETKSESKGGETKAAESKPATPAASTAAKDKK